MIKQVQFDVFMAHNSQDKPQVKEIATKLKQRGLIPWIDEEQIPPGRFFQDAIQQAIPNVKSAAIFIGPAGLGKWQATELRVLFSRCVDAGIPVIPTLLPGVKKIPEDLPFLKELNWVSFSTGIDDVKALNDLEWGITQRKPEIVNEISALSSEQETDYYTRLEALLAAEKWLDADQETKKVILKISGKEQKGQLDAEDCRNLPCQYLREIDLLWVKYSKQRFGLSVQQRIWKNLGGSKGANYETFQRFGECVGWFVAGSWSKNLVFNLSACEGHLPYCRAWLYSNRQTAVVSRFSSLISRLEECEIQPQTACIESTIKLEPPSEESLTQGKEVYVNPATKNSTIWDYIQSLVGVIVGLALIVGILSHIFTIPLFNQWQKQIFPNPKVSPTSRYRQM